MARLYTYPDCSVVCGEPQLIESFREYLIVHQDCRHVEHYSRQEDGSWLLREQKGADCSIVITRLGVRISLADLYATALDLES